MKCRLCLMLAVIWLPAGCVGPCGDDDPQTMADRLGVYEITKAQGTPHLVGGTITVTETTFVIEYTLDGVGYTVEYEIVGEQPPW